MVNFLNYTISKKLIKISAIPDDRGVGGMTVSSDFRNLLGTMPIVL